jgi:hypothetical protein
MKLTSEEIALIEQKREEKRLMKLQSANLYAEYKENRINAETKRCENIKNDAEELKATYESNFNELIKISKDFVLECKKVEQKRTLDLYDVNEEGYEVRSEKPKEIINFMSYHYSLKIKYAGLVPKGHEYYVTMIPQYSKYSGRVNGYKMQIQGTGIYTWDRRGQMTNPKTVVQKLVDHVESQFRKIEYITEAEQKSKRIEDRFKLEFKEFVGAKTTNSSISEFSVMFDNDIRVTFYGIEDSEGNIYFNNPKITTPHNKVDMKSLLDALSNVKVKK